MEFAEGKALGMGDGQKPYLWINERGTPCTSTHVALAAPDVATVDAFHAAALAAGGTDNGAPGMRPQYHPSLLRRLRARPRREQPRGRLPPRRRAESP